MIDLIRFRTIAIAALAAACVAGTNAHAEEASHVDIRPYVSGGKVVTGGFADATGEFFPELRTFGYDFGEDPIDPYFIGDPGFNAAAGSGLTGGSQLRFNILGGLKYWDGTGSEATFSAAPANESLQFTFGAQTRLISSASGPQAGFSLGTASSTGVVHTHLNSFLNGSDGNAIAGDGVEATAGIYAVLLELTSSDANIGASSPFYLAFNNGLAESQHDVAIDALNASLVPEPTTLAAAGMASVVLLRRRRRA